MSSPPPPGVDPEVWSQLPPELRLELAPPPPAAAADGATGPAPAPAQPAELDLASFFATLADPELRRSVLASAPGEVLAQLPPELRVEADLIRQREDAARRREGGGAARLVHMVPPPHLGQRRGVPVPDLRHILVGGGHNALAPAHVQGQGQGQAAAAAEEQFMGFLFNRPLAAAADDEDGDDVPPRGLSPLPFVGFDGSTLAGGGSITGVGVDPSLTFLPVHDEVGPPSFIPSSRIADMQARAELLTRDRLPLPQQEHAPPPSLLPASPDENGPPLFTSMDECRLILDCVDHFPKFPLPSSIQPGMRYPVERLDQLVHRLCLHPTTRGFVLSLMLDKLTPTSSTPPPPPTQQQARILSILSMVCLRHTPTRHFLLEADCLARLLALLKPTETRRFALFCLGALVLEQPDGSPTVTTPTGMDVVRPFSNAAAGMTALAEFLVTAEFSNETLDLAMGVGMTLCSWAPAYRQVFCEQLVHHLKALIDTVARYLDTVATTNSIGSAHDIKASLRFLRTVKVLHIVSHADLDLQSLNPVWRSLGRVLNAVFAATSKVETAGGAGNESPPGRQAGHLPLGPAAQRIVDELRRAGRGEDEPSGDEDEDEGMDEEDNDPDEEDAAAAAAEEEEEQQQQHHHHGHRDAATGASRRPRNDSVHRVINALQQYQFELVGQDGGGHGGEEEEDENENEDEDEDEDDEEDVHMEEVDDDNEDEDEGDEEEDDEGGEDEDGHNDEESDDDEEGHHEEEDNMHLSLADLITQNLIQLQVMENRTGEAGGHDDEDDGDNHDHHAQLHHDHAMNAEEEEEEDADSPQATAAAVAAIAAAVGENAEAGDLVVPTRPRLSHFVPFVHALLTVVKDDAFVEAFTMEHADAINHMVSHAPQLLYMAGRTDLRPLLTRPCCRRVLSFENKKVFFRHGIRTLTAGVNAHSIRLMIRRDRIIEDSMNQLEMRTAEEMRGRLSIVFQGEEGIDAGGVTREWLEKLMKEIFRPEYALFVPSADSPAFQPDPRSFVNSNHLGLFRFVGRVIAKALCDGHLINAHFTRSFYKHILGKDIAFKDLQSLDPQFHKTLASLLEMDQAELQALDLYFACDVEEFGMHRMVELKPGGATQPVTVENRAEYIRLAAFQKMTISIQAQLAAFLEGFHELVPKDLVRIFSSQELELLICGLPQIDLQDWVNNTDYVGYHADSPQIEWFWRSVKAATNEDRAKLLMFVTGTSMVPLEGFAGLVGMRGITKFSIHLIGAPPSITHAPSRDLQLPTAHTCFNQLDLPAYSSYEVLHAKLWLAVLEGNEGFGMA